MRWFTEILGGRYPMECTDITEDGGKGYDLQLTELRDRVWIHSGDDGSTVGRFSRFGIDLHNTVSDQLKGLPQCRFCTHQTPTLADWELFRERAMEFWGVHVPADAFDASLLR